MADRRPIVFAGSIGWLHPGSRRRGVVLASAFGLEGLTAHRAWGELAERLAAAGLPTLRFDWPGTGDSLGDDRGPDRLDHWRAGLGAAIDRLVAETGVEEIAIVGLRLGATIAANVAATRGDVARFVALAPVISGRSFVREQRSLSRLLRVRSDDDPPDTDEIGGWAVGGHFTSEATGQAIGGLDLRGSRRPAGDVAIFVRAGDGLAAGLAEGWRTQGAKVDELPFDDFEAFLTDPTTTRVPTATWEAVVARLAADLPEGAPSLPSPPPSSDIAPQRLEGDGFVEEPMLFGPDDRLFGVLTTPASPKVGAPTVIILPAGRNPHVGWGRGTVELARALAADGRRVFRMDQAGIGDSHRHPGGPDEVLYASAAIADVTAAMDRLARPGDDRFVLVGACSGAHLALHAALAEPRVVGLAMINLLRFVWREGDGLEATTRGDFRSSNAYAGLLKRADTWKRLFGGEIRVGSIVKELIRRIGARLVAKARRHFVTDPAVRFLQTLDRRGVAVLFVFGTADGGRDEFAEHVGAESALPRIAPHARVELVERTDHNLGPRDARLRLGELLEAFLRQSDPAAASSGTSRR